MTHAIYCKIQETYSLQSCNVFRDFMSAIIQELDSGGSRYSICTGQKFRNPKLLSTNLELLIAYYH